MDKTTVIVLVVVLLVIVGIVMYQSSVQAQRDRELQLQLQQMNNQQPQANLWSSIGDFGSLIGTIGGLFGGGGSSTPPPTTARIENTDSDPYTTTQEAAMNGWDYLRARVSKEDPFSMELNG